MNNAIFTISDVRSILDKLEKHGYGNDTPVLIQVDNDTSVADDEKYSANFAEVVSHEIIPMPCTNCDIPMPCTNCDKEALILHVKF